MTVSHDECALCNLTATFFSCGFHIARYTEEKPPCPRRPCGMYSRSDLGMILGSEISCAIFFLLHAKRRCNMNLNPRVIHAHSLAHVVVDKTGRKCARFVWLVRIATEPPARAARCVRLLGDNLKASRFIE